MASHLIIENADPKDRARLVDELNAGALRTMMGELPPDEIHAPAWWHGEDEAFELVDAMIQTQRR